MNNLPTHVMAQEWRYYSREKSIIHTLHLGQLPSGTAGDTIEQAATAPPSTNKGQSFSVPSINIGNIGGVGQTVNVTLPATTLSTCYGSVGPGQIILAQKNMIIQFGVWNDILQEILFTPQETGWFMLHAEATSGLLNSLSQDSTGTYANGDLIYNNSVKVAGQIVRQPNTVSAEQAGQFGRVWATAQGNYANNTPPNTPAPNAPNTPWNPNFYMSVIVSDGTTVFFEGIAGIPFRMFMNMTCRPLGAVTNSSLTGWVFKIAGI